MLAWWNREGPWQRCWASASHKTLRRGAIIGAVQIIVVVFLFSFGGFLAAWSGLYIGTSADDYGNTILFTLLSNTPGGVTPTVSQLPLQGLPRCLSSVAPSRSLEPLFWEGIEASMTSALADLELAIFEAGKGVHLQALQMTLALEI